jgi:radical SAM superfamily enzyme YgiQ (UPF0313 family)
MPKIIFIQSSQYMSRGGIIKQKKLYLPGLVFPLLATYVPKHWQVETVLEVIDDIDYETDADLIGIGGMGHAIFRGFDIAREFRKRGKTVFFGGYMASMIPDVVLENADGLIMGDAEISLPMLISDFEKTGSIKKVYKNPLENIDHLPVPNYEILTKKRISDMLPVQAGRGCNHTCSFCSIACLYEGRHMVRPVDEVIRDIKKIKSLGYKKFYIIDDNLVANPVYLRELCAKIKPLKMKWSSQCTMNLAKDKELLKIVADAGCEILSMGIESISQEGLDKLHKKWLKVNEHEALIKNFTNAGIMVSAEMIIGTDGDTVEGIKKTFDFIQKVKLPLVRVYILTPIPSTAMYDEMKASKRLIHEDYTKYTASVCVHYPDKISPDELTESYKWIIHKIFSLKSIIARTIGNKNFFKQPGRYLFAFLVNLHYRSYVKKGETPLIV